MKYILFLLLLISFQALSSESECQFWHDQIQINQQDIEMIENDDEAISVSFSNNFLHKLEFQVQLEFYQENCQTYIHKPI